MTGVRANIITNNKIHNKVRTSERFLVSSALVILSVGTLVSGSTVTIMSVFGQTQTLLTCTDPTGNNLPCLMVISTLPAPVNSVQCQETTGQILSCSYATQTLSNGQQIVVITVYVPTNFVFSPGEVKVVVHETEKSVTNKLIVCPPFVFCPQLHTGDFLAAYKLGSKDGSVGVYDPAPACAGKTGAALERCFIGYRDAYVTACHKSQFGCGDGPTTCPPGESPSDCRVPEGLPPVPPICKPSPISSVQVACPGMPVPLLKSSVGKGSGQICGAGNCTSGPTPTKVDCAKNPNDPSCQQQPHTAAYLQALNSGSPNPYKPGTKDYEHYQAGLTARQQNSGTATELVTPGGTNGNSNSPPTTTKKCPDGSIIPAKDKCPASKESNPSSPSSGLSSQTSGSLSPPSGGSSGNGGSGGSSSSGGESGGSTSNSGSSNGSSGSGGSSSNDNSGSNGSGSGGSGSSK